MSADNAIRGSQETLREHNRLQVVDALQRKGTATRSELARETGLSRSTVAALVAEFQEKGLVVERPPGRATAAVGRGRPAAVLAIDSSVGAAVGVDLGHSHVRVAVSDLSSTVLAEEVVELDVDHDAGASLATAAELVDQVLAEAGVDRSRVVGAGMGVPAPIDRRTGTIRSAKILPSWAGMQPAAELAERLGLHVELDNDANLGARAEHAFGAGRGLSDFVYIQLREGIGGAIVLGGRLHYGTAGYAGELGHVPFVPDGILCRCGNRGCLETVASVGALLTEMEASRGSALTVDELLDLVHAGDPGAVRVVADAGRAVGRVVADLCNHLNPGVIVVGGKLAAAGDPLLNGIRESIDRYALPAAAASVELKEGVLGERAELLGALALVAGDTARLKALGLISLPTADARAVARA
jgi:predicted NBD/HSP70 family sugar kinase